MFLITIPALVSSLPLVGLHECLRHVKRLFISDISFIPLSISSYETGHMSHIPIPRSSNFEETFTTGRTQVYLSFPPEIVLGLMLLSVVWG